MIDFGWIEKIGMAVVTATVGGIITALLWLMSLGNRVTALETRMKALESNHLTTQTAAAAATREIRTETQSMIRELGKAREDALMFFAAKDDFKDIERKLDELHAAVARLGK